jgi:parvin
MSEKKKLEPLIRQLVAWMNAELAERRVIVKDLQEDLYDGQILGMLLDKLTGESAVPESPLGLGEVSKKQKLRTVLDRANQLMGVQAVKWKLDSIYDKDLISLLHLLVAIVRFFGVVAVRLPEDLSVKVIVIQKKRQLEKVTVVEKITGGVAEAKKKGK